MPVFATRGNVHAIGARADRNAPHLPFAIRPPYVQRLRTLAIQETRTGPAEPWPDSMEARDAFDSTAALGCRGVEAWIRAASGRRIPRPASGDSAGRHLVGRGRGLATRASSGTR